MARAMWKGAVLAESDDIEVVEGNLYFPMSSITDRGLFTKSETETHCFWKGSCNYFNIVVDGETNKDAAWFYPTPLPAAKQITDRIAFWKGVEVTP